MIEDEQTRAKIANKFGTAIDDLVREHMSGLVEEPDITSRIGQRLEDRFNGKHIGDYRVKAITQTITSHGSMSHREADGDGPIPRFLRRGCLGK